MQKNRVNLTASGLTASSTITPSASASVLATVVAASLAAMPQLSHAENYDWGGGTSNDIATVTNWSSASGAPAANFPGDHNYYISNNGGSTTLSSSLNLNDSTIGVGQNNGLSTAVNLTVQNNGTLSVGRFMVAVGSGQTATSTATIQNGGSVNVNGTAGAEIGSQGTGVLDIQSGGSFLVTGDVRVGNAASANGTITNRGTYSSSSLILSENGGTSRFVHEGGDTIASQLFMNSNGPSVFEVQGSGGSISFFNDGTSLTAGSAGGANATLEWVFDAGGATEIDLTGTNAGASIVGTTLNLNIDAWAGGEQVIIDQNGGGLGTSDVNELTVNWTGSVTGDLYINGSGDLVVVPEPGAFAWAAGLLAFVWALRRPRLAATPVRC